MPQLRIRAFLLLTFALLFTTTALAALTFPTLTGRAVDDAHILSDTTRTQLEQTLAAHEQATTNQIVVATLKSLQGDSIESYGYQLGRAWGIGQKQKNNGVLFIVAPNERQVRIEVGYGLEGTLTDALSSRIIQSVIIPQFRAGKMEQGVIDGTAAIITTLGGDATALPASKNPPPTNELSTADIVILFIAIMVFLWLLRRGAIIVPTNFSYRGDDHDDWGGGFSGGGGSFGGGGASGRW